MKFEFESGQITIQADAFKWGPYVFNFTQGLPSGRTISSVVVKSYLGRVKPSDSDNLSSFTETTSELIDSSVLLDTLNVSVYFNRPTTPAWINARHSLVLTVSLDAAGGGGSHSAFFYRVDVI
jgi:hypothetical protein